MNPRSRWLLWCLLALGVAAATLVAGRVLLPRPPGPIQYQEMQKG